METKPFPLMPLGEDFIVKMAPAVEKTEAGILMPDITKIAPPIGVVVAIGPEVTEKWPLIKIGATVQWISQPSTEFEIAGVGGFLKCHALDLAGVFIEEIAEPSIREMVENMHKAAESKKEPEVEINV